MTVKLMGGKVDDDAVMWHMPELAQVTCISTTSCIPEKTAAVGKMLTHGPGVKETATCSVVGKTREIESAIDDCRGRYDTVPTNMLLPAARATACVSCNAEAEGAGVDGPGADTHSSQGNTSAIDMQDDEATGQAVVESDGSG